VGVNEMAPSAALLRSDVELAARGDEVAFARLVEAHHADMVRVAYVITGEDGLAQDAVQSAWLIAWARLRSVRDSGRIRSWLLKVTVNEARGIVRRQGRGRIVEIDPELRASVRSDPAVGIDRLDLVRALGRLSSDDRALLALRYVAGLDAD
jgi:RNA polymerase sigma-70 factor (ECF subfamily)